jgi:hypothetical protein
MSKQSFLQVFYCKSLALYPADFRHKYQIQMGTTLEDMLMAAPGTKERLIIWVGVFAELPFSIAKQQLVLAGGIMQKEMPPYIKRSALMSGVLLLPFFSAITAEGISELVRSKDLYGSWAWRAPVIELWVLILPAIALAISGVAYLNWLLHRPRKTSLIKRIADWRHNWPVLLAGTAAFFVLVILAGHDSVHCFQQNPLKTIRNPGATWSCINNS